VLVTRASWILILGLSAVVGPWPAEARTVVLAPVRDNTLYQSTNGSLSNGAGGDLFSGRTGRFGVRRGLIAFSLTDSIPANAFIDSVQVILYLNKTVTPPATTGLHRVLREWGEGTSVGGGGGGSATAGDATWLHTFFSTDTWTTPGGDFASQPSATRLVDVFGPHTWQSEGLRADVQAWLQDPAANFGWLVLGNEATPSAKRFSSRESAFPAQRPRLVVHFTLVAVESIGWSTIKGLYR
jgi:hypothetical protein